MEEGLNVIYSSDDNYAQHMGVSIVSLLENNKEFKNINIYIIENNISEENKKKLGEVTKRYGRHIEYINFNKYEKRLKLNMDTYISISSYARLFIPEMLPIEIEKVIYIDCDTIINNSLKELWNDDIENYAVAGVKDFAFEKCKEKIGIDSKYSYINAGVMVFNIKKMRESCIQDKFLDFIDTQNGNVYHHDQGVINGVLKDLIKVIPPKYNAMTPIFTMNDKRIMEFYNFSEPLYTEKEYTEARMNPVIIHYTPAFTTRPWFKECRHPKKDLYFKYLNMSPWKDYKVAKSNDKLKLRIVKFLYNHLPFKIFRFLTKKR